MRNWLVFSLFCFSLTSCSCGESASTEADAQAPDAEVDATAATDAAIPNDSAGPLDAAAATDVAAATDAGVIADSASAIDTAAPLDASAVADGSATADVLSTIDAGGSADGADAADAAMPPDAAVSADISTQVDATVVDATPATDAAPGLDMAPAQDAAPAEDAAIIPDGGGEDLTDAWVSPCDIDNGGCDWRTECLYEDGGASCGPCPQDYTGDGESGCVALGWDHLPPVETDVTCSVSYNSFIMGHDPASGTWYHTIPDQCTAGGSVIAHALQPDEIAWTEISAEPRQQYGNNWPAYVPRVSPQGIPHHWLSNSVYAYDPASNTWPRLGTPPDQAYDRVGRLDIVFYPDGTPVLIYTQDYQIREGSFPGGVFARGHFTATGTMPFNWEDQYQDWLIAKIDDLGRLHAVHRYEDAQSDIIKDHYIFEPGEAVIGPTQLPADCGLKFLKFTADNEMMFMSEVTPLTLCWRDDQGVWQQLATDKALPTYTYRVSTVGDGDIILLEMRGDWNYELWFLDEPTATWYASPYLLYPFESWNENRGFAGYADGAIGAGYRTGPEPMVRMAVYVGPQLVDLKP